MEALTFGASVPAPEPAGIGLEPLPAPVGDVSFGLPPGPAFEPLAVSVPPPTVLDVGQPLAVNGIVEGAPQLELRAEPPSRRTLVSFELPDVPRGLVTEYIPPPSIPVSLPVSGKETGPEEFEIESRNEIAGDDSWLFDASGSYRERRPRPQLARSLAYDGRLAVPRKRLLKRTLSSRMVKSLVRRCRRCSATLDGQRCTGCATEWCAECGEALENGECRSERCASRKEEIRELDSVQST